MASDTEESYVWLFTCGGAGQQKNRPGSLRADGVHGLAQKHAAVEPSDGYNHHLFLALPDQLWQAEPILDFHTAKAD